MPLKKSILAKGLKYAARHLKMQNIGHIDSNLLWRISRHIELDMASGMSHYVI
jgi:hypothetical protein